MWKLAIIVLSVWTYTTDAQNNCADCTAFTSGCAALKTYLQCITMADDGPCTVSDAVKTAVNGQTCSGADALTPVCTCMKNYAMNEVATDADKCSGSKAILSCISFAEGDSCATGVTKDQVATKVDARQKALTQADPSTCAAQTATCKCEADAAKTAFPNAAAICTAYEGMVTCLKAVTDGEQASCTATKKSALSTTIDTNRANKCGCKPCQTTYTAEKTAAADDAAKCTALGKFLGCLNNAYNMGTCLTTADRTQIKTDYDGANKCTSFTATCKCQVEFNYMDMSTDQKKCDAATKGVECLEKITTETEAGCNNVKTQKDMLEALKKAKDDNCDDDGAAGHVVFSVSLLLASMLASIFM